MGCYCAILENMYTIMTMEFAIIETGGKQYRVSEGDTITIEKLSDDMKEGDTVTFDRVLMVDNDKDTTIGTPYIKGASVTARIEKIGLQKKVRVVKYKAKSRYTKVRGHRQPYFLVKVTALK